VAITVVVAQHEASTEAEVVGITASDVCDMSVIPLLCRGDHVVELAVFLSG
jgi:hypothetical protein